MSDPQSEQSRLQLLADRFRAFAIRHRRELTIAGIAAGIFLLLASVAVFMIHQRLSRIIDARLGSGSLRTSSIIYAEPRVIAPGDPLTAHEIVTRLQRAGYTDQTDNKTGYYRIASNGVELVTGTESYFQPHRAFIEVKNGKVAAIRDTGGTSVSSYRLEPEIVTNVLDEGRGKRTPVAYSELPAHLVHAIVSVEDKRFFHHSGLDFIRVAKAAYVDLKEGRKEQGASTINMQIARSFWLDQDKTWKRKITEALLALALDHRFSKEEVLQLYANEVYLGRSGSFSVHGFGEAARAFFGKDVRDLTLAESATLAGIIQRPSYFNPFRYKDRVRQRRDLVLELMRANRYIDDWTLAKAKAEPLVVKSSSVTSSDAPYFVDLVNGDLQEQFPNWDFESSAYRIYSTLDLDLQRAAEDAIEAGLAPLNKKFSGKRAEKVNGNLPQVAMVVLDAKTGAIRALVGGRNYAESQLNRVFAMRQPGSTFKPFVYAAAMQSAVETSGKRGITAGTVFNDQPTTFTFRRETYQPANFGDRYLGNVTARRALANSLNIPTVKAAELIGYQPVVNVARAAGISAPLEPTPSLALGSYEISPIELAEAYTVFPNRGVHVKRNWVSSIRSGDNRVVYRHKPQQNRVLDERVAYIVTNIMEDVVQSGTAAGVRAKGFKLPAAGKTGTARDGWFAGFTSELLTVVWVGFDDYSDLATEGSKSALPIWTEFMKRAHSLHNYADAKPFQAPDGLVRANIDATSGLLADSSCEYVKSEFFIKGTQPTKYCTGHYNELPQYETASNDETIPPATHRRTVLDRIADIFR